MDAFDRTQLTAMTWEDPNLGRIGRPFKCRRDCCPSRQAWCQFVFRRQPLSRREQGRSIKASGYATNGGLVRGIGGPAWPSAARIARASFRWAFASATCGTGLGVRVHLQFCSAKCERRYEQERRIFQIFRSDGFQWSAARHADPADRSLAKYVNNEVSATAALLWSLKMFRDGDSAGAKALSARETLGLNWAEIIKRRNLTCLD